MYLGRHELGLEEATAGREWLLTNGLGGFAMSTVGGLPTRRYHGWLVPNVARYGGRFVVLSQMEEEVRLDGEVHPLSSERHEPGPGGGGGPVIAPRGYRHLQGFALAPLPVFTFYLRGFFIERTLFMPRGENRIVAVYRLQSTRDARLSLRLRPLMTFRFYHHLMRANDWPFRTESGESDGTGWVTVQARDDSPALVFRHDPGRWSPGGAWRYGVEYLEEQNRGLDHVEDLYTPGFIEFSGLGAGDTLAVTASLAETPDEAETQTGAGFKIATALAWQEREEDRLSDIVRRARLAVEDMGRKMGHPISLAGEGTPPAERRDAPPPEIADPLTPEASALFARLVRSTDAFIAVRGGGTSDAGRRTTVIAGYPWFEDWGRDTMIAFPGLFLVTGRFEKGFEVLGDYAAFVKDGLLPNRFPDQAQAPDYNTVDASLWFFRAVQAYLAYTGDRRGVKEKLLGSLWEIATHYYQGTAFGIGAGPDGLIHAGQPGFAVTWMDAKLGGWVVTPRHGYPVEINALWYNALSFLAEMEGGAAPDGGRPRGVAGGPAPGPLDWSALADRVRAAFNDRYWNEDRGCLFDVLPGPGAGGSPDASIRPNQLLAVSLPNPVLRRDRWRAVVDVCLRDLYTTFGLRTLAPHDPAYRGLYRGGPAERDGAYHQGTVWPWLLGPFITAMRKAEDRSESSRLMAARMLQPFERHIREAGIGYISEVFDGDFPFLPGGAIAQAWSVAEVLRAYMEEVLDVLPEAYELGRAAGPRRPTAGGVPRQKGDR